MNPGSASFDIIRELGNGLPRVKETFYYRSPALAVDGEVFAVQTSHSSAEPNSIGVAVSFECRDQLISENPRVFYLKPHYENYPVVLVRLDQIDRNSLREMLRSAHDAVANGDVKMGRSRVPRRLSTRRKFIKRRPGGAPD
jgi:hypothetical protein